MSERIPETIHNSFHLYVLIELQAIIHLALQFYPIIPKYNMQKPQPQSYAPFGSLSYKPSHKKKKKLQNQPGPGSYEVSLPLINPIVQTIRKKNNNIIVKLGHIGTPAFYGDERFTLDKSGSHLGPGQYNVVNKEKVSPNKRSRTHAATHLKHIISNPIENSPTISDVKKVSFDDEFEMPSLNENIRQRLKNRNLKGSGWSKLTGKRSYEQKTKQSQLGPGHYDLPSSRSKNFSKGASPAFVSESVRSFFDQIRFETNHESKARQRENLNYKSEIIGPGSYEIVPEKKIKVNKYQFFGSTEDRNL